MWMASLTQVRERTDRSRLSAAVAPITTGCWCISKGMAGMLSQTSGLAKAVGVEYESKSAALRFPWNCLPLEIVPQSNRVLKNPSDLTATPRPRLVISCGRQGIIPSLFLKRELQDRVFTVHIQDPKINPRQFDLLIVPDHDLMRGPNVYRTTGALHYVTPDVLEAARQSPQGQESSASEKPLVPVLLGGRNGYYAFSAKDVSRLITGLRKLTARNDVRLVILKSRRTPEAAWRRLQNEFGNKHYVWNGEGTNPYFAALATARWIVVTGDSVSMASEAVATGRPVFIASLTERRPAKRFRCFHEQFQRKGFTRPFDGQLADWSYTPPNDTFQVARLIRERMGLR